jgi:transposase
LAGFQVALEVAMAWRRGQAYGQDLRDRVLAAEGETVRQIAARLLVSPSYVVKVRARLRQTGEREARAQHNHLPLRLAPMLSALRTHARRTRRSANCGPGLLPSTACRSVTRHVEGPCPARADAQKKRLRAAEQDRPDVAQARRAWIQALPRLDPDRLVFLDETWATTNMTRPHGRAPRGARLVAAVPHGHWHTTTNVRGLRSTAPVAPLVLDGAINGGAFGADIEQMLAPTLAPGDIVIMDNLGSHKVGGVREAIEARGAELLYLPPYSPDLNPIELAFSKLKRALRSAAARTLDGLWNTIASLLDRFTPAECAAYFRHCGYAQSER